MQDKTAQQLRDLAAAVIAAESEYNGAWTKEDRRRLAEVSRAADRALEDAMGQGIDLALNVMKLLREAPNVR